eukprot:TRINITY_DN19846_c0_g1_i1.p1 TRINITY_DN19846_c0_g1~~TRINITY_DN19846_c0_g1_i1.p1  ORF type:complete len:197 (+),score=33.98 TRINITY_DN19846_c0_g1_i1:386-976(+)
MAPQPAPADTPAPAATDVSAAIATTAAPTSPNTATTTATPAGADASTLSKSELLERLRVAEATIQRMKTERDAERTTAEDSARRHESQRAAVEAGHRTQKQRSVRRFFATICRAWAVLKRQQREVQMLRTEFIQLSEEYAEEQGAATAGRVELRQAAPGADPRRPAAAAQRRQARARDGTQRQRTPARRAPHAQTC